MAASDSARDSAGPVVDESLTVTLVDASTGDHVREFVLDLPSGSTVQDLLNLASRLGHVRDLLATTSEEQLSVGVWGRHAPLSQALRVQDRVEIYRPLRVDPKVARRERFVKQGAKTTGLFAKRRPGAKAGY